MKQLNIVYEDKDHSFLCEVKEIHGGSWHDFILDLARIYKEHNNGRRNRDNK